MPGSSGEITNIGINSLGEPIEDTFNNDTKKSGADGNICDNCQRESSSYKETAQLHIRGHPLIKAKKCITMAGVGKGDGKWYCHTVEHGWSVQDGYITKIYLTKGKGGGGGGGGGEPTSS